MVRAGAGTGFTQGIGTPRLRLLLALGWEPEADKDQDLDGIVDRLDACDRQPEDMDGWEDTDGCAEPTQVTVRVVDPSGQEVPGAALVFHDETGGPKMTFALEAGTYPARASATQYQTNEVSLDVPAGPPVERTVVIAPWGHLKVVVVDVNNAPMEAPIVVGCSGMDPQTSTGPAAEWPFPAGTCKVSVRKEGYGAEVQDVTLNWAEDKTVTVMLHQPKVTVTRDRIDLKDSVYFDLNLDTIKAESFDLLNEVVTILTDHPEITRIRIEGHTDDRGSDTFNLDLSKRRAASVRTYLIARGVAADRVESEGYGESRPLVKRQNEAAWSKNRRVDFFIVARTD